MTYAIVIALGSGAAGSFLEARGEKTCAGREICNRVENVHLVDVLIHQGLRGHEHFVSRSAPKHRFSMTMGWAAVNSRSVAVQHGAPLGRLASAGQPA